LDNKQTLSYNKYNFVEHNCFIIMEIGIDSFTATTVTINGNTAINSILLLNCCNG